MRSVQTDLLFYRGHFFCQSPAVPGKKKEEGKVAVTHSARRLKRDTLSARRPAGAFMRRGRALGDCQRAECSHNAPRWFSLSWDTNTYTSSVSPPAHHWPKEVPAATYSVYRVSIIVEHCTCAGKFWSTYGALCKKTRYVASLVETRTKKLSH